MSMSDAAIQSHYGLFARKDAILSALAAAGKNVDHLTPDDLAPFDQLHTSGHRATHTLIDRLAPGAGEHLLDVGCGIGGPARLVAQSRGCRVTGIDLTADFIATAQDFTCRTGQADAVTFQTASATALPFAPASFDVAWHIHMSMNVADKPTMYAEIFRVLKPGGRFAFYDPIRGPGHEPLYPVPWAMTPDTSFLLRRAEMMAVLAQAGFRLVSESDETAIGLAWFDEISARRARAAGAGKPAPPQDPRFVEMTRNHRANLESGAIAIHCAVFERT